jgi:hypothetical protein
VNFEKQQNMARERQAASGNLETSLSFNPLHASDYLMYRQLEQSRIRRPLHSAISLPFTVI